MVVIQPSPWMPRLPYCGPPQIQPLDRGLLAVSTLGMLKFTLKAVIIAFAVFSACTVGDVLYRFYDLRNSIVFALRAADLESEQELRKKVFAVAVRAGIRCEEQDIVIKRSNTLVRAEFPYRHWIGVPFANEQRGIFPLALRASGERAL